MHRRSYSGRKFSREAGPRRALMRSLATSIILYEKVETTKPKAKEAQRIVEKLITCGKKGSLASLRKIDSYLLDKNASKKIILELSKLYKDRNGGYARVLNIGFRTGDSASMARIELLDTEKLLKTEKPSKKTEVKKETKTEKKPVAKKADKSEVKTKKEPSKKKDSK
ncbi:50S ribosomal protein L17 [bacterium (Candidatus Howlettbacteria) CG_4_10_14_0_8_um_filter_40_9]|nr:MAG: 50S ribosomal protein L17 [bacterium (Candidatus Howlettbacteria) CG_4_10_14_0_8_um_filter_40_9]